MAVDLLIRHHAADPHFNMAFDECMFAYALGHPGAVLVRLYTWQPGAITFGFNQNQETALDFARVGDTPVIRRITGGRAVYHDVSELTYAVAINPHTSERAELGGRTSAIYRLLSSAIMTFLERRGVRSELVQKSSLENSRPEFFHKAPCFESSARYEIVAAGRKIVASAQKQIRGVVLQHGSMKVSGLAAHPALDSSASPSVTTSQPVDRERFDRAVSVFAEVFSTTLGVELEVAQDLPDMVSALERRVCEVKKNAQTRRNIFEQTS
ncbi:MAG: lipoate--protein ligase family protein [bacterium]|nr:lipoate--protein ligase family protein [bacterium]